MVACAILVSREPTWLHHDICFAASQLRARPWLPTGSRACARPVQGGARGLVTGQLGVHGGTNVDIHSACTVTGGTGCARVWEHVGSEAYSDNMRECPKCAYA